MRFQGHPRAVATMMATAFLAACGGGDGGTSVLAFPPPPTGIVEPPAPPPITEGPPPLTVPKAVCAEGGTPESALQGQVPAALRQAGFQGFSCNLKLAGQFEGEGGTWSSAFFRDPGGRTCAYHATAHPIGFVSGKPIDRVNPGVPVIDITDPAKPWRSMSLTTAAMIDPWESLRVNARRQLLLADNGGNSGLSGGAEVDIYDLSADCRTPQLLASMEVGTGKDGGFQPPKSPRGHEGNVSPDGLTYYIGDIMSQRYHAVDITNSTRPRMVAAFDMAPIGAVTAHGLSVSEDGRRAYVVSVGTPTAQEVLDPNAKTRNGFLILDTSEVQARVPNAQMKVISATTFKDGSVAQHTIPVTIAGKPYLVMVDEGGAAGKSDTAAVKLACEAKMAPYPMARIYDISDEKKPVLVSKLMLETHDPMNCDKVLPDIAGLSTFTYGSHYCSVDNRNNGTALACSYFNSGVRVFDIRNPERPKEIAYYNPAGVTAPRAGSIHRQMSWAGRGGPDWCASRVDFDFDRGLLTTMCQDNGLLMLKFAENTWPFAQSTPSMLQN
ncbi:LVIVD repeat-containing protein [Variovorax sp. DAIF25]|uniref:LVIVD repeat-containing protein n=1 Tax=Variovorax sp. DAIF25 TaxID=3080983 RepID=UPI003D6C07AF